MGVLKKKAPMSKEDKAAKTDKIAASLEPLSGDWTNPTFLRGYAAMANHYSDMIQEGQVTAKK